MTLDSPTYDAIIIGGGPAGSTAALVMAREGLRVKLLERTPHPRFHIGESLLPRNMALFHELGLDEPLRTVPTVRKLGAEFVLGDGKDPGLFPFSMGLVPGADEAVNLERAPFDAMLLNEARKAGAEVAEGTLLKKVLRLEEGHAEIATDAGETLTARFLVDASGQSTVLGKHLGLRKTLPDLKKVAYFGHFENVKRRPGDEGGYIVIVMTDDGWFWSIPLTETKTKTMSILAGHVYPRPAFALRWRFWLLSFFLHVNRYFPIASRRERFSLLAAESGEGGRP